MNNTPTYKKIAIGYKHFKQSINTVWESFQTIDFYLKLNHTQLKHNQIPPLSLRSLQGKVEKTLSPNVCFGSFDYIINKKNMRMALIESVTIFEEYIGKIVYLVYNDFPEKVKGSAEKDDSENKDKIMQIIFSSDSKEDIIDRLIEERIRNLFYGNIADLFIKDRAKLELRDTFTIEKHKALVNDFIEISSRRNIYIHNNGRVDRKYIRETKIPDVKIGAVLSIDEEYIKKAINTLKALATIITVTVLKNIYNVDTLSTSIKSVYKHLAKTR